MTSKEELKLQRNLAIAKLVLKCIAAENIFERYIIALQIKVIMNSPLQPELETCGMVPNSKCTGEKEEKIVVSINRG